MTTDLRYPIGPLVKVPTLSAAERADRIAAVAALPAELRAIVAGMSDAQLDTPYRPGGWTARQVVHHLADSHMNAFIRFKWALTESNPTIKPYDEQKWAELPDSKLPVEVSLRIVESVHERWVALMHSMSAEAFTTPYQHPESGPHTLDMALNTYAWHGKHHCAHIANSKH